MWSIAVAREVSSEGGEDLRITLIAMIKSRNSVVKSSSEASCNRTERFGGREDAKADFDVLSQRRETPFASKASATRGRCVVSAASSTNKVSALLQAAG